MSETDWTEVRKILLKHYRDMRNDLLSVIDGLSDELMAEQSIDGWSVKDHLVHLAFWHELRANEILRISAGYEAAWPPVGEEQTEGFNSLIQGFRKDLSVDQAKWELESSRQRVIDAISTATERGLDSSFYKEAGLMSTHEAMHAVWIKRWREQRGA